MALQHWWGAMIGSGLGVNVTPTVPLAEHVIRNDGVGGSIPSRGTIITRESDNRTTEELTAAWWRGGRQVGTRRRRINLLEQDRFDRRLFEQDRPSDQQFDPVWEHCRRRKQPALSQRHH
jgi:hypothetical protein